MNWSQHITYNPPALWQKLFYRADVILNETTRSAWIGALAQDLLDFRLALRGQDDFFVTYATSRGFSQESAIAIWRLIEKFFEGSPFRTVSIRSHVPNFPACHSHDGTVLDPINLVEEFTEKRASIIRSNLPHGKNADNLRIGSLGELLAYIFVRDLDPCACIYHKLSPDNPETSRHGVDLLAVKFGESELTDEVHVWEAKATGGSILNARDEIIDWFNVKLASRINLMIESAKKEWRVVYPEQIARRATRALSRFEVEIADPVFVGSIAYDPANTPGEDEIRKFDRVRKQPEKKRMVLFSLRRINETANEVFNSACSI